MPDPARSLAPIQTAHLYPEIESHLLELLRSLTPAEWSAQTVAPKWTVKDVAAHLLDTQLRKLSRARDGYRPEPPISPGSNEALIALIDRLNEEGVTMYRRLSPRVLIALMELASRDSAAYHASLDPLAPAPVGVSWAGESSSANWFDTAREFTERWHHQQQIRLAVNRPGIMTPRLYYPVLDCFMRALPYAYRNQPAEPDSLLHSKSLAIAAALGISAPTARLGSYSIVPAARSNPACKSRKTSPGAFSPKASAAPPPPPKPPSMATPNSARTSSI